MYQIKEVAPIVSKSQRQFWKHDVKMARDFNKTNKPGSDSNTTLTQQIADEFKEEFGENDLQRMNSANFLKNVNQASYQNTWSPMTLRHEFPSNDAQKSRENMEKIYLKMAQPMASNNQYIRYMIISIIILFYKPK